jgi:hypothetical protein
MANIGMRFGPNSTIKAVEGDEWKLRVLGIPYGNKDHKDFDNQYFTKDTDIMMAPGEKRPALYYHGMAPNGKPIEKPEVIGTAEYLEEDKAGRWFTVVLDKTKDLAKRIWRAAQRGSAYASSGAIAHLFRGDEKGKIDVWPVGELSLMDVIAGRRPSNWDAVALPMKAVFNDAGLEMPESFVEAGEAKADEEAEEDASEQIVSVEVDMAPFVAAAAGAAVGYAKGREEQWTRKS